MSTVRGTLSVTIPSGSTLDLSRASCNIGSFTSFIYSPSSALPNLPSYAHRMLFRVQVGTAAWLADVAPTPLGSYPNGSLGIITSSLDPKPVQAPGLAQAMKIAALGGAAVLNALFYEGDPVQV